MSIRLRHVAAVNPPTHEFDVLPDTAELPFLPLEAVWPGDRLDTTRRQPKSAVSSGYTRFREGDILLPKITPTFQADRTVIVKGLEGGVGAGTTELHVVRAGPDADVRYLRYLLSSKKFLDEGEASMLGVAGQKRVPDDCLRDLRVPVVDLRHQRAIADYLDRETARIDALIEKKGCLVERLGERRQSLITGAVTGELGVSEMAACRQDQSPRSGDPRAITGGDRVKTIPLKRIVGINLYTLPETTEPGFEFRYVDIGAVGRGQLVSEPEVTVFSAAPSRARRLVRSGDTIISTVRTYLRAVWPVRDSATDLVVSTGFAVLTPTGSIDSRYLGWLAQSDVVIEEVVARSVGVSYPAINPSDIGTIRVPLPPLPYQLAIADYLDRETARIDALIKMINQQTSLLAERRQALITAAATGELQIPGVAA